MAHELAGALQQAGRIRQRCAVKEPHVYVRVEYIDVAEGHISQTYNRAAVMQKLPDFVPAFSHHLKPLMRDGSQFTCMLFHPRIDGGIPLDSAVESQQFRSHRRSTFFEIHGHVTPYTRRPLACRARRHDGYFLSNAVAFTDSGRHMPSANGEIHTLSDEWESPHDRSRFSQDCPEPGRRGRVPSRRIA